ncbi:hypothetical protein [Halalkalibacter sp. APA_J-10(15)]|uniref:hypothetical protein n=1 Tax=Halalkalibacter sp. APA_J-10(15) TaxID=2933805 RepID=UPI001FF272DC|nr:hypothetical protein [Halalkalibacter sp. APA_J-10(15)]MCK0470965.1 hypothetical protein [Halalkalibacter sp. APA_J-10(15)]
MIKRMMAIGLVVIGLTACGTGNQGEQRSSVTVSDLEEYNVQQTAVEVTEGDFIYRLVSEKDYYKDEAVQLYAELEYIGEKDEMTIYHAASPFYFPMKEEVRGFDIGYSMNEPLVETILQQGEPYREKYQRSGGYSDQDEEEYQNFMKDFLENGFLTGYYIVNGFADFYVGPENEEKDMYRMEGQIGFKVEE